MKNFCPTDIWSLSCTLSLENTPSTEKSHHMQILQSWFQELWSQLWNPLFSWKLKIIGQGVSYHEIFAVKLQFSAVFLGGGIYAVFSFSTPIEVTYGSIKWNTKHETMSIRTTRYPISKLYALSTCDWCFCPSYYQSELQREEIIRFIH